MICDTCPSYMHYNLRHLAWELNPAAYHKCVRVLTQQQIDGRIRGISGTGVPQTDTSLPQGLKELQSGRFFSRLPGITKIEHL